jgi:PAS domain S-box-containing protein
MYRILIVDDEESIGLLIKRSLEPQGHHCTWAASGKEARGLLEGDDFDLIICDINMPGETGLELVRYVKEAYPEMATLMVTVMDDPRVADELLELGVYGYIIKPFMPNEILIHVSNALKRRELEIKQRRQKEILEQVVSERTSALKETLRRLEEAHEALKASERRYRDLFESSKDVIYYTSREGKILDVNPAGLELFGYSREEIDSIRVHDLYEDPGDRDRFVRFIEESGYVKDYELRLKRKDGSLIHALVTASVMRDENGRILGYQGIIKDVTEQRRAERALRESEERYRNILSSIEDAYYEVDLEGNFTFVTEALCRITGLSKEELIGLNFRDYMDQKMADVTYRVFRDIYETGTPVRNFAYEVTLKDGRKKYMELSASLIRDENGRPVGFRGIARDVTEQKLIEMQMAQSRKLEAIGQLAAGIAHEINTPIQYVGDNTRFLKEAFDDLNHVLNSYDKLRKAIRCGEDIRNILDEIEEVQEEISLDYLVEEIPKAIAQTLEGVERVSGIVRSMKEFSHPGTESRTTLDLNRALSNTLTITRNEWKYVADVETDFDPMLPPVPCHPGEINQVFLNIIVNSAHAIREGLGGDQKKKGRIRVETKRNGSWVEVRISDTGPGIPQDIRDRIFDPFFTTKDVGVGAGQGLAIAYDVVTNKHKGSITFESEPGRGTTFIVRLPIDGAEDLEPQEAGR